MATIRFANRIKQAGVFHTGTPDYVQFSGAAVAGYVTLASVAEGVWADNDIVSVLIYVDDSNYKVWLGYYDKVDTAYNVYLTTEEFTVGTINDTDAVTVSIVPTAKLVEKTVLEPQFVVITGTTHTTLDVDCGKVHRYTSGSAVTVTLGAGCRVNWHAVHVQEGAGLVSFARDSTDTVNGGTTNVDMAGQYKTAYTYQHTEGAWIAAV